jgi:hypothetical protein
MQFVNTGRGDPSGSIAILRSLLVGRGREEPLPEGSSWWQAINSDEFMGVVPSYGLPVRLQRKSLVSRFVVVIVNPGQRCVWR